MAMIGDVVVVREGSKAFLKICIDGKKWRKIELPKKKKAKE